MLADYYRGKNVLVTGGAGFIGSHVVEMLVELGAAVTVPVRKTTNCRYLRAVERDIRILDADLFDRQAMDRVLRGQQIVLNLAAAKGGGIANSILHHGSLFRDNMLSFINVLDAARTAGVERFLVVSSACVYPRDTTIPTPEAEGMKGAPEAANAGYGWSKRMEEYLASAYREEFGMNIGVARPYNCYGPRDDFFRETNHVIPGLITRLFKGENPLVVWGDGKQTRAFLYVTDFARGLLEVCASPEEPGPLNLGTSEEVSIGDLVRLIVEVSGIKTEVRFDPSKPVGQPRRTCDTRLAAERIGFRAKVSLREGLTRTIEWYRAELKARSA